MSAAPTRRALLGGAGLAATLVAVPIAAKAITATTPTTAEWDRLVAAYNVATEINDRHLREYSRREERWFAIKSDIGDGPAAQARRHEIMGDIEAIQQKACNAQSIALSAIREHPAASQAMLVQKVQIMTAHFDGYLEPHDMAAILADFRRLNQGAGA